MFQMTEDAATLVRNLTVRTDTSPGAGLRIVVDHANRSLSMGIVAARAPDDVVVSRGDARIFLSRPAARRLHQRTLHAELSPDRSLFFLDH